MTLRASVVAVLLAVLAVGSSRVGEADPRENTEKNYSLDIPSGWSWDTVTPDMRKFGIEEAASRRLTKLKDGAAPNGQGAKLHLAIQDSPAGKDLDALAADAEIRAFLLGWFDKDASKWPTVHVSTEHDSDKYQVPIRLLAAEGRTPNLDGAVASCRGVMILAIAKKKLFKIRMYAWPTEKDGEGLCDDLDLIEMNFDVLQAADTAVGGPPEPEPDAPPVVDGDSDQEKVFDDNRLAQGWKLVKPKLLKTLPPDPKSPDIMVSYEANDRGGSAQVTLYAYRNGQATSADQDFKAWNTTAFWEAFDKPHPEGEAVTYRFPRAKPNASFLVLPDFEKPEVVFAQPKQRPEKMDAADMIKKYKIVEETVGKLGERKIDRAFRGVLKGNRPRVGPDITLRYSWWTPKYTFLLYVNIARDGLKKFAEPVAKLLASIEFDKE
jgi:hypothetical protein